VNPSVKLILWQKNMIRVLLGTLPLALSAIYFFGWRVLAMLAAANAAGFLAEYAFCRPWKQPVSSAVFVTATLLVLSVTPALPLWMAVAGVVFAVVFGKMTFGGFGRNVFNPALTGRAFLYICFGAPMTALWFPAFSGLLGGLASYAPPFDAITTATPGMLLKSGQMFPLADLFFGRTSGTIGGTSAVLALAGGLYLLITRTANFRIPVSGILGFLLMQTLLWKMGVPRAADPLHAMLAGSFLVGIFFYATDPVSASQTDPGRWLFGALVGILSSLIGIFSVWPAGTMFAILLANMFAPITDHAIRQWQAARRATPAPAPPAGDAA
jgi:Na+-transporting NADH:ubiquinone oxidoreductase subunit B